MEANKSTSIIAIVASAILGVFPAFSIGLGALFALAATDRNSSLGIFALIGALICAGIVGGFIAALISLGRRDYQSATRWGLVSIGVSILAYCALIIAYDL